MSVNSKPWNNFTVFALGFAAFFWCPSYALSKMKTVVTQVDGVVSKNIETFSVTLSSGTCVSLLQNKTRFVDLQEYVGKHVIIIGEKMHVPQIYDGISEYRVYYNGKQINNNCPLDYVIKINRIYIK